MADPLARTSPRAPAASYTLLLLFLVNVLNVVDRTLLGIVVDPVKAALGLDDTEMSVVSGSAFVLFNLLVGVFIARWVDRGNRKWILVLGVALWCVATALSGLAQGFGSLALSRVLVGVGEATAFPVAISMIADLYDAPRRPRAISIFQASIFIGIVGGSILAGVLAATVGWRAMFLLCGGGGLLLVLTMAATMAEPARGQFDAVAVDPRPERDALAEVRLLLGLPGFLWLSLGTAFAAMATAVLPIWAPAFLLRSHGVPLAAVGALIGPAVGIGGITGRIVSGMLATRCIRRRGTEAAGLLVPLAMLPFAAPAFLLFAFATTTGGAMTGAAIMNFLLSSAVAPCYAAAVAIAPAQLRAMASTLVLTISGVLGGALAPSVVGVLSDLLTPSLGGEALRYGLASMAPTPLLGTVAVLFAYLAVRRRG